MKKNILLGSGTCALLATTSAILTTTLTTDPQVFARAMACSGYVGLLSIGLFFVGLVFPKD